MSSGTAEVPVIIVGAGASGLATGASGTTIATTLVTSALRFDRAVVAHVGDSRCYLIRRGRATLLTRDHTIANEQVRLGLLSAREATEVPTPWR